MVQNYLSSFNGILGFDLMGNNLGQYLAALLVILLTILLFKLLKSFILGRLNGGQKRRQREKTALSRAINALGWPLYFLAGLWLTASFIVHEPWLVVALRWLTVVLVTYYLIRVLQSLVDYGVDRFSVEREEKGEGTSAAAIKLMGRMVKILLWVIGSIIVFQNLGYNISALAAGLGIGGLAIAFALQNVLGDVFASFSIYFDRPFEIGDFIIVGSDMGIVQHIGIKSTRVQTLQGQELVISNRELTETRVHNYRKMERRRIVFNFGVEYGTPEDKLARIPEMVKEIVNRQEEAEADRVHFKAFGAYSLDFEAVYYINNRDYARYMDIQQDINLEMKKKFAEEGIAFAFPRQDVFLVK